jgi:hypothetical protein
VEHIPHVRAASAADALYARWQEHVKRIYTETVSGAPATS